VRRSGDDAQGPADAQAPVEQCAVTEGLEFANDVVGAEIAGRLHQERARESAAIGVGIAFRLRNAGL
jgi:hypothetical protein